MLGFEFANFTYASQCSNYIIAMTISKIVITSHFQQWSTIMDTEVGELISFSKQYLANQKATFDIFSFWLLVIGLRIAEYSFSSLLCFHFLISCILLQAI